MYANLFCEDCQNNWTLVPGTNYKNTPCPSCKSTNTRGAKPDDPSEKSEVVFDPTELDIEGEKK